MKTENDYLFPKEASKMIEIDRGRGEVGGNE